MQNFLTGRKQQQKSLFFGNRKPEKNRSSKEEDTSELIELAASEVAADNAPRVEMVMENDVVQRIIITMQSGQRIELDCEYEEQ